MTSMKKPKFVRQCPTCPWKVGADVNLIPNYRPDMHAKLTCTIASDERVPLPGATLRLMACHYSTERKNKPCVGWLHHQIGVGNNIGVRLAVMNSQLPVPKVEGDQYETFEETLNERPRQTRKRR